MRIEIENDARVQGSDLDGGEQFVLCGRLEIPTEGDREGWD